jgi:lipopolysaccharide export LptBFGC system permease protein LptF
LGVGSETYDDARRGDHAEVRLWQGDVVELRVRGHIDSYAPSSQQAVLPWLALGCLILAGGAWALLSGRLSGLFAFPNFGLLFVAVGVGWLGSMALFGGHPVVWVFAIVWTGFAVFWTVGAWQDG